MVQGGVAEGPRSRGWLGLQAHRGDGGGENHECEASPMHLLDQITSRRADRHRRDKRSEPSTPPAQRRGAGRVHTPLGYGTVTKRKPMEAATGHQRAKTDLNRLAVSATTHCLTGCAIG